jgi:two-component system chemotaxis response regulator CheY
VASVLIVDDSPFIRQTLAQILQTSEYEVIGEAATGTEAVAKYRLLRPDLVIMDVTMPEMDGIQALKCIHSEFQDAQIVMCSTVSQQRMMVKAIESGAKDFIVKPFHKTTVLDTVHRLFRKPI